MSQTNLQVKSISGQSLDVNYYSAMNPKGLVQILHGMQEHKERYDDFACFLAEHGYHVVIHDHLGHGKSISNEHPLGDMISFDYVIKDIDRVRQETKFDGKYIILGHSMGSFLARIYASLYTVDRLVATGTGQTPTLVARLLKFFLMFNKSRVPLDNIQKLVVGAFSKKFENPGDWLSYNKENQDCYAKDPLCGKSFTREGYKALMDIVITLNKTETYKQCTAKEILLASGREDPVGNYTKGVEKAAAAYRAHGKNVEMIIYDNMTHEILNETEKQNVYNDILYFINK